MGSLQTIRPYSADGGRHSQDCNVSTEEALECPFCFRDIDFQILEGVYWEDKGLQLFLKCKRCKNVFTGYTKQVEHYYVVSSTSKGNHKPPTKFDDQIEIISPSFISIYGEAELSEQENLKEICGMGYRKALEFLIKDYLIKKLSGDERELKEKEIKEKLLGKCIEELIDDPRIREIAKRAAWLGNDETHYFKIWKDKDLEDLKKLINLTVHFIIMEFDFGKYKEEMPENGE